MTDSDKEKRPLFDTKRCPNCGVDLPLYSEKCTECDTKVGKVGRFGRAKEPVDWAAYTLCAVSWFLFGLFLWWGFFRD